MRNSILLSMLMSSLCGPVLANEPQSFEYRAVRDTDLTRVQSDWESRDLSAQNAIVVYQEERSDLKLLVVRHDVSSRAHFGAILVPQGVDLARAPVVVLPDGLEQFNPTFDLEQNIRKYQSLEFLRGFIKVLPAFRGRFMGYRDNGWYSRGDFCDAYDGSTDDSIAMVNVAEQLLPEAGFEKILVWGGSRGGNTALLMAVRDPRVNTVIAIASPVDFYREDWQVAGSNQYRCQFFDGKNEQETRHRMLASSPLFFEPNRNLENVFLHHDAGDNIVAVWNAHRMATRLEPFPVSVTKHIYPTVAHGALAGEAAFWENLERQVSSFQESIGE